MWIFGKDRAAFPYEVDATSDEAVGDWVLRSCKHTKTGASYSAWVLSGGGSGGLERARAVVKRMKTLRHPNFVTFADSHESGEVLTLITESVMPLATYLRRNADSSNLTYLTSWGIYQITKALDFFNKDCKLQHNNVRLASVFVTPAGDWKLAGLEFVEAVDAMPDATPTDARVYWPRDKRRVDSWGLGCLIWEVYNTEKLREADQLRHLAAIPQALVPTYSELVHPKGARRCTVNDFFTRASATHGFFDNFFVRSLLFLEEIQIKDKEEKLAFLSGLADDVNAFPDDIAKYKLLPHLMQFLQYGGAGAEVLTPLLRLGKLLDSAEFEQKVLPCLVKLFSSPDRATRVRLLEQLPNFIDNLPAKCVNDQIFQPVCQGFSDTNPLVREATIRAMVPLATKLSDRTINEALPRHLTQLQVKDDQGGIRANATICLAKLAGRMSARIRHGPLLNAFLKCTRDPYPPARRMAVIALATTLTFYTLKDTAGKVMPCLAFLTIDPEREVRDETFRALASAIARLEKASSDPEVAEREDRVANSGSASDGPTGVVAASAASAGTAALAWTNWAVSTLSSKFIKSSPAKVASDAAPKETEKGKEKAKEERRGTEGLGGFEQVKKSVDGFVPDTSKKKPASTYNWDRDNSAKSGWDNFEVDDDDDDDGGAWESLETTHRASPVAFGEAAKGSSSKAFGETSKTVKESPEPVRTSAAPSMSFVKSSEKRAGGSSRGAMKLGKKVGNGAEKSFQGKKAEGWDSFGAMAAKEDDWGVIADKPKTDRKSSWDSPLESNDSGGDWDSVLGSQKKGNTLGGDWDSVLGSQKKGNTFGGDWNVGSGHQKKKEADFGGGWDSTGGGQRKKGSALGADRSVGSGHQKKQENDFGGDWDSSWSENKKNPRRKARNDSDGWDAW